MTNLSRVAVTSVILLGGLWSHAAFAADLYVSPAGTPGDPCTIGDPCDFQTALDGAAGNGEDNTVHLTAGLYADASYTYSPEFDGPSLAIVGADADTTVITTLSSGLVITSLGPIEVSGLAFRDNPGTGLSIVDSGDMETGVYDVSVHDCIFDGNVRGLEIFNEGASGSATISDNTFEGNEIDEPGAGLFVDQSAGVFSFPLTITGNTFTANVATDGDGGGAYAFMRNTGSAIFADGNVFTGNTSSEDGGGLFVFSTGSESPITVGDGEGNTFTDNTAEGFGWGGGFYARTQGTDSPIVAEENVIRGNEADIGGGFHVDTDGGGGDTSVRIVDNVVGGAGIGEGNVATSTGGGTLLFANDGLIFDGNRFLNNDSFGGAGGAMIYVDVGLGNVGEHVLSDNVFVGNEANADVGGLHLYVDCDCSVVVERNFFSENSALGGSGGGMLVVQNAIATDSEYVNNVFANNTASGNAGGVWLDVTSHGFDFTNNTVTGNSGDRGGGLYAHVVDGDEPMNFYNNIFWENEVADIVEDVYLSIDDLDGLRIQNNDLSEACADDGVVITCNDGDDFSEFGGSGHVANNVVDIDPDFVSLVGDDAEDFALDDGSPVADIGNASAPSLPSTDYLDKDRTQGRVDLGAFEFQIATSGGGGSSASVVVYEQPVDDYGDQEEPVEVAVGGAADEEEGEMVDESSPPVPRFNAYTGHNEAPASVLTGVSPFDMSIEAISSVAPGWYVRGEHYDTVYYVDEEMRRHPLWDVATFFTWADSWDDVIWVTDATLPTLPMGPAVLPKAGVVLVKTMDAPSVYAIGSGADAAAALRAIPDESAAVTLYGQAWADYVIDLDPTIFSKFGKGAAMSATETADRSIMKTRDALAAAASL